MFTTASFVFFGIGFVCGILATFLTMCGKATEVSTGKFANPKNKGK